MVLDQNEIWKKENREERFLFVTSGRLWVTRLGDAVDRILESGDTLELKGNGWVAQPLGGKSCDFTTLTCSPAGLTPAIPSLSSSRRAG